MLFKDITGQEEVKKRLIQTVKDSRVSHAQLFLGPEGSGKLSLAIAYAQYINCKNKKDKEACGECASCVKYKNIAHPDLHFVYPVAGTKKVKSKPRSKDFSTEWRELILEKKGYFNLNDWYNKIGIENKQGIINAEDCNEIIKTLSYKSYESEYKVMIIWMVEKLFYSAAPKILKILEEPPEKTLFILISENQDQIINTIISRTQIVKIHKLKEEAVKQTLVHEYEVQERDAAGIAVLSNGNMIDAIRQIQQSEDEKNNFDLFVKWMRLCYSFKVQDINEFVAEIAKIGRERQKSFLAYAIRMTRNSLLMNYNIADLVKLDNEENGFMTKFSPFINPKNGNAFYDELNKAYYHVERNANPSILFTDLSLKAASLLKTT